MVEAVEGERLTAWRCRRTSGNTTPCKVTLVILHGVVSPELEARNLAVEAIQRDPPYLQHCRFHRFQPRNRQLARNLSKGFHRLTNFKGALTY